MMLTVIGFDYKSTPIALREKLAISADRMPAVLREIRENCRPRELMVLSTCNRVEFYLVGNEEDRGIQAFTDWLRRRSDDGEAGLERNAIVLTHRAALMHLFRVACSLESMVIGEPQILGQVKEAYRLSLAHDCHGPFLNGLMPRVFRAAKRVRTETNIARFPVSISRGAVQLAGSIFESLEDKSVMVIGAGEMAELTVIHLMKMGIQGLQITNRTFASAVALAERYQGRAVRFEDLGRCLPEADIVVSSTGAPGFVITKQMARRAMEIRKGRPLFFIDIAVPRDVDPEVHQLSDVYCYDIDDLQAVSKANKQERAMEVLQAQAIIEQEIDHYAQWYDCQPVIPTIKALRRYFEDVGEQELQKSLSKLGHLSDRDAVQMRKLVRKLVNRLLHTPSTRLKEMGENANVLLIADTLNTLFDLHPPIRTRVEAEQSVKPRNTPREKISSNVIHLPIRQKPPLSQAR